LRCLKEEEEEEEYEVEIEVEEEDNVNGGTIEMFENEVVEEGSIIKRKWRGERGRDFKK
jgi:hypothetical protein